MESPEFCWHRVEAASCGRGWLEASRWEPALGLGVTLRQELLVPLLLPVQGSLAWPPEEGVSPSSLPRWPGFWGQPLARGRVSPLVPAQLLSHLPVLPSSPGMKEVLCVRVVGQEGQQDPGQVLGGTPALICCWVT